LAQNRPSQKTVETDFASSALLQLVLHVLHTLSERSEQSLILADLPPLDAFKEGRVPKDLKKKVLDHAYQQGGALPLLAIGQFLDQCAFTPIIHALAKSADSSVLAAKWIRLEAYYHSHHRVAIDQSQPQRWLCTRSSKGPLAPSRPENLLICGLMAGFLTLLGQTPCHANFGPMRISFTADMAYQPPFWFPDHDHAASWTLQWRPRSAQPHSPSPRVTNAPSESASPPPKGSFSGNVQKLMDLFSQDHARLWTVADAASHLSRSPRSLQRDMQAAGHSFTSLVRASRVQEACRLLSQPHFSLADIGYCCGYADQAHFQRDFVRLTNMTPAQFRRDALFLSPSDPLPPQSSPQ